MAVTLLLVVLPLLLAPLALAWYGRWTASGAVLLFILYTRLSDVRIDTHGVAPIDPQGLSVIAQVSLLALTALVFVRRTSMGGARSLASGAGPWIAMGLYVAVLYASSIWAPDQSRAAAQGTSLVKNLLIVYVIAEICNTPRAQRVALWSLLGAGVLMAGLTIAQAAAHTYDNTYLGLAQAPLLQIVGSDHSFRSSGPIGDPNFYALILTALVPVALLRARDEQHAIGRWAALACAIVLLAAIVLTYSRGAIVTLAAMGVLYVLLARVRPVQLLPILVLLVPVAVLAPSNYLQRVTSIIQGDDAIQSRIGSQQVALAIFADHPLLGTGADSYADVYFPYALRLHVPGAAERAHDSYLEVVAETGLAGLLTFAGVLVLTLNLAWRRRATAARVGDLESEGIATACLLALLAYVIGIAFLPLAYPRYLWILVGVSMAAALPAREMGSRNAPLRLFALRGAA